MNRKGLIRGQVTLFAAAFVLLVQAATAQTNTGPAIPKYLPPSVKMPERGGRSITLEGLGILTALSSRSSLSGKSRRNGRPRPPAAFCGIAVLDGKQPN
jgi:hypothetical protein